MAFFRDRGACVSHVSFSLSCTFTRFPSFSLLTRNHHRDLVRRCGELSRKSILGFSGDAGARAASGSEIFSRHDGDAPLTDRDFLAWKTILSLARDHLAIFVTGSPSHGKLFLASHLYLSRLIFSVRQGWDILGPCLKLLSNEKIF